MKEYEHLQQLFSARLRAYCEVLDRRQPADLYESQSYFLSLGGKRLRPLLALIGCDLFGADPKQALPAALAIELFHNFSLIHDDILDKAPLRRGKPTVHEKWNAHTAILAGDAMLIEALRCLEPCRPAGFRKQASLLCATAVGVCEGQQLDMSFESRENVRVKEYLHMITGKTGVLLGCALQMGAIAAGAKKREQNRLHKAGTSLGVAFQLTDDLLDAYAEADSGFGKQTGGDILSNKKTFLLLKAKELGRASQRKELDRLMQPGKHDEKEKLRGVLEIFDALDVRSHCQAEADRHTQTCIAALDGLNADAGKTTALKNLAIGLLSRKL